jgi:hypothetical protein
VGTHVARRLLVIGRTQTDWPDGTNRKGVIEMKPIQARISYFDSIYGGAGLTTIPLLDIALWLAEHPGTLIYGIVTYS